MEEYDDRKRARQRQDQLGEGIEARRSVNCQEQIPCDLQGHRKVSSPKDPAPACQDDPVSQVGPKRHAG